MFKAVNISSLSVGDKFRIQTSTIYRLFKKRSNSHLHCYERVRDANTAISLDEQRTILLLNSNSIVYVEVPDVKILDIKIGEKFYFEGVLYTKCNYRGLTYLQYAVDANMNINSFFGDTIVIPVE
jgi:hypothetical protein